MKKNLKSAFTLAEAIITIGVIGVVTAILMPILLREVTQNVDSSREANIAQKITKAMENMSATGDFTKFNSTDDFVDVLQKLVVAVVSMYIKVMDIRLYA